MKLSGPSFDTKHPAGAFAGQPSCEDSPAKKPDEPDNAKMALNCVVAAEVGWKSNTELPLPGSSARSAAVKVRGAPASEKLPTGVVPLKIVSTRLCIVIPVLD